jgi:hypothetical protein
LLVLTVLDFAFNRYATLWFIGILTLGSLPVIALGIVASLIFARSFAAHPYLWTAGAIVTAVIGGAALAGVLGAVLSFSISIPAVVTFLISNWVWPLHRAER